MTDFFEVDTVKVSIFSLYKVSNKIDIQYVTMVGTCGYSNFRIAWNGIFVLICDSFSYLSVDYHWRKPVEGKNRHPYRV